jgi:hypothetical protein
VSTEAKEVPFDPDDVSAIESLVSQAKSLADELTDPPLSLEPEEARWVHSHVGDVAAEVVYLVLKRVCPGSVR